MKKDFLSNKFLQLILSLFLLFLAFLFAISFGAEKIKVATLFGGGDKYENIILWQLRLPRVLLVLLTGILLGGSGAVFQLFFRNPLAEPGIMGISAGATLGAVIAVTLGIGGLVITGSASKLTGGSFRFTIISPINFTAFIFALGSGLLVTLLAFSKAGKNSSIMLLLCGTAMGTLYSAVSSLILLTSNKELHSIYSWILGSFSGRGWNELVFILLPSLASIIIMLCISRPLDLLSGGETSAASLGVNVNKLRVLVLLSGSLAISSTVCSGGTISFVGLIAPHIVRKIVGPKARYLIPFSMIFGAILILLADTLARIMIAPAELPAGIITAILGVPFFLTLCLRRQ